MRRKQISIRSSRSALPHRYLRYISWVHRPQPSTSWIAGPPCAAVRGVFAAVPMPQGRDSRAPLPLLPPGGQANALRSFLKKKKTALFPFFARLCVSLLLCCSARSNSRASPRSICGRSIACPSRRLLRPSHKQKKCGPAALRREPAHQKSVDFSLKKTHVGTPGLHALASAARTYSLTARVHYYPFSFLLFTKEKKKENRSKFSRFEYIARTHFVRPHDVRDWPVAPRPLKFM